MKCLSRRDFIHAGCTVAIAMLVPPIVNRAKAGLHLHGSSALGRSIINGFGQPDVPFANFFKSAEINVSSFNFPAVINADGYPTSGSLASAMLYTIYLPPIAAGVACVIGFNGQATIQFPAFQNITVSNGGAAVFGISPANTGTNTGNFSLGVGTTSASVTQVTFSFDANYAGGPVTFTFVNGFAFASFADLYFCRSSDLTAVNADRNAFNPDFVSKLKSLKPLAIRGMDWTRANNSNFVDHAQRPPLTSFTLSDFRWSPTYYGGATSNSGDDFTGSNPSGSGAGAYVDGETAQVFFNAANTTMLPRLQLGTRGFKPIIDQTNSGGQKVFTIGGTVAIGDVFNLQFYQRTRRGRWSRAGNKGKRFMYRAKHCGRIVADHRH